MRVTVREQGNIKKDQRVQRYILALVAGDDELSAALDIFDGRRITPTVRLSKGRRTRTIECITFERPAFHLLLRLQREGCAIDMKQIPERLRVRLQERERGSRTFPARLAKAKAGMGIGS